MKEGQEKNVRKNRVLKYFKILLSAFTAFNIVLFLTVILNQSVNRPYPIAKAYMASSFIVNTYYFVPLSQTLGIDDILVQPFQSVRNYLYNEGVKNLPENDAEKDYWWYRVKFYEFEKIHIYNLYNYFQSKKNKKPFDNSYYQNWFSDIYSHIVSMANKKTKDTKIKKRKVIDFVSLSTKYLTVKRLYLYNVKTFKNDKNKFSYESPILSDNKEVDKYKNILSLYLTKVDKNFQNTIGNIEKKDATYYLKNYFFYKLNMRIVGNKIINKEIDCNDRNFLNYLKSRKVLKDSVKNKKTKKSRKEGLQNLLNQEESSFILNKMSKMCL